MPAGIPVRGEFPPKRGKKRGKRGGRKGGRY